MMSRVQSFKALYRIARRPKAICRIENGDGSGFGLTVQMAAPCHSDHADRPASACRAAPVRASEASAFSTCRRSSRYDRAHACRIRLLVGDDLIELARAVLGALRRSRSRPGRRLRRPPAGACRTGSCRTPPRSRPDTASDAPICGSFSNSGVLSLGNSTSTSPSQNAMRSRKNILRPRPSSVLVAVDLANHARLTVVDKSQVFALKLIRRKFAKKSDRFDSV